MFQSKSTVNFRLSNTVPILNPKTRLSCGFWPLQLLVGLFNLFPADINLSTDATAATPFYFKNPVYLSHGIEYCFALLPAGNNPDYEVFVSEHS